MPSFKLNFFLIFHILFFISIFSLNVSNARILYMKQGLLLKESLPRGTVPPPNGCTYIPGEGGGPCTLKEKHFSGGGSTVHHRLASLASRDN
ncbi:hypothetical protein ACS0TY_023314 [Phlomoides rotata]